VARLRAALGPRGPALLVTRPSNLRWLCGFTGSAGRALVARHRAVFLTDSRYAVQARREVRGLRRQVHAGAMVEAVAAAFAPLGLRRLGFEADHLTVAARDDLSGALPGVRLVPTRGIIEGLRASKDQGEIAALRGAVAAARRAFARVAGRLRGRTEIEVARDLEREVRRAGADGVSFPVIVASGPNGALPHAAPGRRRIRSGDAVVIDFGAVRGGYRSDVTRTVCVGKWDERVRKVYRTVLAAQRAAIDAVRPGVQAREVDAAGRRVIESAGLGKHFGHAIGHGVGLEVHELPVISARSGAKLLPGMVLTIEPGVYLEGCCGVRIEDMILVTSSGREVLSRGIPKSEEPWRGGAQS
jgi:Xaa-Pro aminopeptidase